MGPLEDVTFEDATPRRGPGNLSNLGDWDPRALGPPLKWFESAHLLPMVLIRFIQLGRRTIFKDLFRATSIASQPGLFAQP
jgi:hypothetical protein